MIGLETLELEFVMSVGSHHFALRDHVIKFGDGGEQKALVGTFEVFVLFTVVEGDKIWDTSNMETLSAISGHLCINSCKNKIGIFIWFSSTLKNWFNSHARRTRRAPEINDKSWALLYQLLELWETSNLENLS